MTGPAPTTVAPSARLARQLKTRVEGVLRDAREQLDIDLSDPGEASGPLTHAGSILSQVTWTALARLEGLEGLEDEDDEDEQQVALTSLALRANDLEDDVRRYAYAVGMHRRAQLERGLTHLRPVRGSAELLDRVCAEIVRSCGFTRAMLSRVDEDLWYPWMVAFKGAPESGDEFREWIRGREIPIDELTLERTLVAEKRPDMVLDAAEDPRSYKPFVAIGHVTSYVVAPIIAAGRVVGFLHADHGGTEREVDEDDRDVLWAFAEGFGRIYERVVLLERTGAQRRLVRETLEIAEEIAASLAKAEIELEHDALQPADPDDLMEEAPAVPRSIDELLTAREKEVFTMMVRGMPNAAIAEHLVIRVGTVKSHVKHILRKIGAVNRAAAIAKYMGVGD